jgi:alanyl-tRNA synthetase
MMTSAQIRQQFLDFFKSKGHHIVSSAPIVVKNDPTLLFTNAGMNQFKDFFLGNKKPDFERIADTQKCLRVSGKHNDLEEVGVDTYHHTMFEMLGNWSFGNYFKAEAIAWSWELLVDIYKLDKDRLYVTIFEGDAKEGLPKDEEAFNEWKKVIAEDRILLGNKKDNFWEMGDTGPCGPCTEIHVDCRPDAERKLVDGKTLVNNDHPQVIEIWNNVFMQFNRLKDGTLQSLPAKHVDTGMGFERLVRVIQNKTSNYDTDVFTGTIEAIEKIVNKKYDFSDSKQAIAFRVIADHIRAIAFTVADGQLPSNTGAGYVIRRILRRAVRYYYSYLDYKQPLLHQLMPTLAKQFENVFPELNQQLDFVSKVVKEEEDAFLRTLDKGLKWLSALIDFSGIDSNTGKISNNRIIPGDKVFELYDTYGFPLDLTKLIANEEGVKVDEEGFNLEMLQQKNRSRAATAIDTEDWVIVNDVPLKGFVGYTQNTISTQVNKYRKVKAKGKEHYQIVLVETPFYAESGGQVGDTGKLTIDNKELIITDTKKENNLIIHFADALPANLQGDVIASIDASRRRKIARHHSVTHLMHAALRKVLGNHVAQKGSLVNDEYLRFDFSHFAKMTDEEIAEVEKIVNRKIRQNIPVVIKEMPKEQAIKLGAMALFGEKYGDVVRVVIMDENYSIELCGGTHVMNTGELNIFKIMTESAVAAGVRRIEALAGCKAEAFINEQLHQLKEINTLLKTKDALKSVEKLVQDKQELEKQIESLETKQLSSLKSSLLNEKISFQFNNQSGNFIGKVVEVGNADHLKKICFDLKNNLGENYVVILSANINGKANVAIMLSDSIVNEKGLEAPKIIKEHIAPLIKGGGGGQKTLATAGGQDASNLSQVIEKVKALLL